MNLSAAFRVCRLKYLSLNQQVNYATVVSAPGVPLKSKKKGKLGAVIEKTVLPVETDPEKLVKYVCGSNINKEGVDIELKPDSEYPDWLWTLNTGKPTPFEELDPNSKEYWLRARKMWMVHHNKLTKLKRF